MKENQNLKRKIKIIEDSSKIECEALKKSLVEVLEKNKILEKKKDDKVDSRKNSLKSNLESKGLIKHNSHSNINVYEEKDNSENIEFKGKQTLNKVSMYEEKIEKLALD